MHLFVDFFGEGLPAMSQHSRRRPVGDREGQALLYNKPTLLVVSHLFLKAEPGDTAIQMPSAASVVARGTMFPADEF